MNYVKLNTELSEAVAGFDAAFIEKHKDMLDFGDCGMALVMVFFGRKRKIKNEFMNAGLTSENRDMTVYGKKGYVIEVPRGRVPTQYRGYYEDRARLVQKVLESYIDDVEFHTHSWAD